MGNAGGATASKFWASTLDCPMTNGKEIVPRFASPSCNWKMAAFEEPHVPNIVNVNGLATAVPPEITPKFWGPLGDEIPPPLRRVATRLVVGTVPTFRMLKFAVTVSPGSTALFEHPSAARENPFEAS